MRRIICKAVNVSAKGSDLENGVVFDITPNALIKKHQITFKQKNNKIYAYINNKKMTKCDMSMYFSAWDYYSIYWNSAKYNEMAECLYTELLNSIY